ncbi:hypothetical protein [Calothrix sp. PCC 6303]|nr:hypothetical protein [Calothrix sp. PCC 6303]
MFSYIADFWGASASKNSFPEAKTFGVVRAISTIEANNRLPLRVSPFNAN